MFIASIGFQFTQLSTSLDWNKWEKFIGILSQVSAINMQLVNAINLNRGNKQMLQLRMNMNGVS